MLKRQEATVLDWILRTGFHFDTSSTEAFKADVLSVYHPFDCLGYRWPSDVLLKLALEELDWKAMRQEYERRWQRMDIYESVPHDRPGKGSRSKTKSDSSASTPRPKKSAR